ncbi:MAG: DUF4405 domain-containing protein [Bacteroidetes bacterium]|nr:DUF4405 domain-containing protein [Bacteroidota bacterium]
MEKDIKKKPFNKRAFISIAMFTSGLCLPFSGIMNHNLQFETLSVERHFWMSVHNMAAVLFVIFAILHISYNWRALMSYAKKAKEIFISKESLAAIALVIVIVGLFASHTYHVN